MTHRVIFLGLPVVAGLLGAAPAQADEPSGGSPGTMFDNRRLTGGWFGLREGIEERGVVVGGAYVAEFSSVLDGGVNQRGSFRNLLTIDAEADLDTLAGLPGGTLFVQYLSVNAESGGSLDAGDLQIFSNIESVRSLDTIYELWYEQRLLGDRLRIKLGKLDANSEFNSIDAAGDFANSSAGFSPTIFAFPSYPDPATSVNVFGEVVSGDRATLTLGYGLYDGALAADGIRTGASGPATFFTDDRSGDWFHVAQADLGWEAPTGGGLLRDGRIAAGVWHHTGEFTRFDGSTDSGATGAFLNGEIRVFDPGADQSLDPGAAGPERGVSVIGQYGWADGRVSAVEHHVAAGAVVRGPTEGRPDDSAGVYVSLAVLSDEPGAGFDGDELAIDAYYRARLAPAMFVQPEIQYIVNPGGDAGIENALVAGCRVGVAL